MNRREFLQNTFKIGGALFAGIGLLHTFSSSAACRAVKPAAAGTKIILPSQSIIENKFQFRSLRSRSTTNQIVIHHTGIDGNRPISASDIHQMHLKNGWSGIGYHLFIRKDGTVETGRPLQDVGAHAYGHNQTTVGICLAGNFDIESPTEKQVTAAAEAIAMICRLYALPPRNHTIVGHRDLDPTDCPGNIFYPHLYALREHAAKLL